MKWGLVMEDLKSRGVADILVVCTDDLNGFSEQTQGVFPYSIIQKCIIHQVRNSLKYVDEGDRKAVIKVYVKYILPPQRKLPKQPYRLLK